MAHQIRQPSAAALWALAGRQHGVVTRQPMLALGYSPDAIKHRVAKPRTPAQQATDRLRDQAHAAVGRTTLRFTHAQIAHDAGHVRITLAAVAGRLRHVTQGRSRV